MLGKYERTIFEDAESGYNVLVYSSTDKSIPKEAISKCFSDNIHFTVVGYYLPKTNSVGVELTGKWVQSKFGLQLLVEKFTEVLPKTKEGLIGYLSSGLIKGIGPKTAKEIVNRFGTNALDVLDKEPEKLLQMNGITEGKLKVIIDSHQANAAMKEIATFLSPYGISVKKAMKIHNQFGAETMNVLYNRPFELCNISGFGFKTVDAIARSVNCAPDDLLRIQGAVLYSLDEATVKGHVFLKTNELIKETYALLNEGFHSEVVGLTAIKDCMQSYDMRPKITIDGEMIYKSKAYQWECDTAEHIADMAIRRPEIKSISTELEKSQKKLDITLSDMQKEAVKTCFTSNISIITGGPGTGKTTVLKVILDVYERIYKGNKILLTAPTGRASRRMSESTGFPDAQTLHSAMGLKGDEVPSDEGILLYDFIVVDEFSMVDMWLCHELFKRIMKNTKVLLVGDADQLPSVGPGNVFRELINCSRIPVTKLDVVFRQAETSRIAINAHEINKNSTNLLYGPDFELKHCDNDAEASDIIKTLYMQEVEENGIENVQILAPFRVRGESSSGGLNTALHKLINPPQPGAAEFKVGKRVFRFGDKVMQTKNKGDISNGDIGFIMAIAKDDDGVPVLKIQFSDERVVLYHSEDMDTIEHAYAMTIHKSQGSEYDTVIIPILSSFYIMLRRNLIYTAITRAKKKVVLVGEQKALFMAIHKNDTDKRNTLLAQRIIGNYERKITALYGKQKAAL